MDRRRFLQSLTVLGTGSTFPAFARNETSMRIFARGTQLAAGEDNGERQAPELNLDWRDPPRIGIVSIGSAGSAILSRVDGNLPYLSSTIAVDTDPLQLHGTRAGQKVLAGNGQQSSAVDTELLDTAKRQLIAQVVSGLDVAFIVAGMGGTAGTDLSQIVADISGDAGILTIAAAMMPVDFDSEQCRRLAQASTRELCRRVEALVPLPNYRLSPAGWDGEPIESALDQASATFGQLYRGIAMVLGEPGLIGIDPEDIREMLSRAGGYTAVGCGYASGNDGGEMAIRNAINNPMLGQNRLSGASGILLSIEGKPSLLKMKEVSKIVRVISNSLPDVTLIFGAAPSPKLTADFRVTLLASGFQTI